MLEALFSRPLYLGLAPYGVALLKPPPWWRRNQASENETRLVDDTHDAPGNAQISVHLRDLFTGVAGEKRSVHVTISDALARYFMVKPARNTATLRDCKDMARMRFEQLYGETESDWVIQAEWQAQQAFLACALPQSLLSDMTNMTNEHRITFMSIAPQFVRAWNRWHTQITHGDWFAVIDKNTLSLACIDHDSLCDLRVIAFTENDMKQPDWLMLQIHQQALRQALVLPIRLSYSGSMPYKWHASSAIPLLALDHGPSGVMNASEALRQLAVAGAV